MWYVLVLWSYCVDVAEMFRNPPPELIETRLSAHGARRESVPLKEEAIEVFTSLDMRHECVGGMEC